MLSSRRLKSTSLVNRLLDDPDAFSFYQAIKLLEHYSYHYKNTSEKEKACGSLGVFVQPDLESVSFQTKPSLKFPDRYLASVTPSSILTSEQDTTFHVAANVISLAGTSGVLPYHYTELILQRIKQKDSTLATFLDLFNHRTLSLLYRSHWKYRFDYAEALENSLVPREQFSTTPKVVLKSLTGIGTSALSGQLTIPDESLLYFSGLFTHSVKSTHGLKQLLSGYFKLPFSIEEFIGKWQSLDNEFCTQMGSRQLPKGLNAQLGCSAMLGSRIWVAQGKIRIVVGPLTYDQYLQFSPSSSGVKMMNELANFYLGFDNDYEFVMEVDNKHIPKRTQLSTASASVIGWNSWLPKSKPSASEKPVRITLSTR
jgi:type VI secretion system protein ImpH